MTDQEMRIAIAEACGWEWWHCPTSGIEIDRLGQLLKLNGKEWKGWVKGKHPRAPKEEWHLTYPPDYLNDLNAIAEAERARPMTDCDRVFMLAKIVGADMSERSYTDIAKMLNATARQRSEAFLRAIGKRRDG